MLIMMVIECRSLRRAVRGLFEGGLSYASALICGRRPVNPETRTAAGEGAGDDLHFLGLLSAAQIRTAHLIRFLIWTRGTASGPGSAAPVEAQMPDYHNGNMHTHACTCARARQTCDAAHVQRIRVCAHNRYSRTHIHREANRCGAIGGTYGDGARARRTEEGDARHTDDVNFSTGPAATVGWGRRESEPDLAAAAASPCT